MPFSKIEPQISRIDVEGAFLKGPVSGKLKRIPGKKGEGEISGEADFFSVTKPLPKNLSDKEIDDALNIEKAA